MLLLNNSLNLPLCLTSSSCHRIALMCCLFSYPQRILSTSLLPRKVSFPQIPVFRTQRSGLSNLNITPLWNVPFLSFLENTKQSYDISRAILSHLDIKFCSMDLSKQCPPSEWGDMPVLIQAENTTLCVWGSNHGLYARSWMFFWGWKWCGEVSSYATGHRGKWNPRTHFHSGWLGK